VTEIRERQRKLALARVQSDVIRARERLAEAERTRDEQLADARDSVTGDAVSAASLALVSSAMQAGKRHIDDAVGRLEQLDEPLRAAQQALGASARERLITEKWLERRRRRQIAELRKKAAQADDELTAARSA